MSAKRNECKRCGWSWKSLYDAKPRVCPRCKSYKWDEVKAKARTR